LARRVALAGKLGGQLVRLRLLAGEFGPQILDMGLEGGSVGTKGAVSFMIIVSLVGTPEQEIGAKNKDERRSPSLSCGYYMDLLWCW
jgi:hypothetical protein